MSEYLPMCMYVHHSYLPDKGIGYTGTGVKENCELPHEFWSPNISPLKEQQLLVINDPSSRPPNTLRQHSYM